MIDNSWQYKTFGPATSAITLATKGGATLGGFWISAKGTTPVITAADTASAAPVFTTRKFLASTTLTAIGNVDFNGGIACGYGLAVRVASCSGTILWRPSSSGV